MQSKIESRFSRTRSFFGGPRIDLLFLGGTVFRKQVIFLFPNQNIVDRIMLLQLLFLYTSSLLAAPIDDTDTPSEGAVNDDQISQGSTKVPLETVALYTGATLLFVLVAITVFWVISMRRKRSLTNAAQEDDNQYFDRAVLAEMPQRQLPAFKGTHLRLDELKRPISTLPPLTLNLDGDGSRFHQSFMSSFLAPGEFPLFPQSGSVTTPSAQSDHRGLSYLQVPRR